MARSTARIFEEYLVASARAGDRLALERLAGLWQKKLVAHAWRLTGSIEDARDAAQAGWIEILRGLDRLQDERAFPAWAYRIVSRACARQIGAAVRRRRVSESLAAQPEPGQPETRDAFEGGRLRAAIRALPPEQRAAIGLFHFEDMSIAEVAASRIILLLQAWRATCAGHASGGFSPCPPAR